MWNNIKYGLFVVSLMFIGCDSSVTKEDVEELCDGSSDLVLSLRFDAGSRQNSDRHFFTESGISFVHLTGKCEFWSGDFASEYLGHEMRVKVQTGQLTTEDAIHFLELIKWKDWQGVDSKEGLAGVYSAFWRNGSFNFSGDNADIGIRQDIAKGLSEATAYLSKLGKTPKDLPLRIYLSPPAPDSFWDRAEYSPVYMDWPIEKPTSEVLGAQNRYCYGRSFLITDALARKAFWDAREEYSKRIVTSYPLLLGVKDGTGQRYELSIRDALPFENEIGLVNQGEFGTMCFGELE